MSSPHRHSIKRITGWSAFLALALFFGLVFWYLPSLLVLDMFRPDFIDVLESTFHCRAEVGHIQAQLIPAPGLFVGNVALLEPANGRVLASVRGVRIALSWKTALTGRMRFGSIRFMRPRFIAHRETDRSGKTRWTVLSLPHTEASGRNQDVESVNVINGSLEIWDHTVSPIAKWVVDGLSGNFHPGTQQGTLAGRSLLLGPHGILDVQYQGAAAFPVELHLSEVSLRALASVLHAPGTVLDGSAEAVLHVRFLPAFEVHATLQSLRLASLKGIRITGFAGYVDSHLRAHLQTLAPTPMRLTIEADLPPRAGSLRGDIQGYDAAVVHQLYEQPWINRLAGPGTITFSARSLPAGWSWSADGRGFDMAATAFHIPDLTAEGNAHTTVVDVHGETAQGGMAEVVWEKAAGATAASLTVDASSVTVRQMLDVFGAAAPGITHPYEAWPIAKASVEALLQPGVACQIKDSDVDIAGMHLDLAGRFETAPSTTQVHIQGDLLTIPLAPVVESLSGKPESPVTGTAQTNFDLTFPLSDQWMRWLNGTMDVAAVNGVVHTLKVFYRIASLLNLTNYLRLHLPQVTAQGIVYQTLDGHLRFENGVVYTEDLFLKSPSVNVGIQGAVDLPEKREKITLRIELFRFLEEVLKTVPITHWIFKKSNKIFLPVVVTLLGPWDNPDIR